MINENFLADLKEIFRLAEQVQGLFRLALERSHDGDFFEEAETKNELVLRAAIKANSGIAQSIDKLRLLQKRIKEGIRPSGLRCDTISEELFTQACNAAQWELAVYAMADIVSLPSLEMAEKTLQLVLMHTAEMEDVARRLCSNSKGIDEIAGHDFTTPEAEARPAAA